MLEDLKTLQKQNEEIVYKMGQLIDKVGESNLKVGGLMEQFVNKFAPRKVDEELNDKHIEDCKRLNKNWKEDIKPE